jgi:serine/threonine protein kinase
LSQITEAPILAKMWKANRFGNQFEIRYESFSYLNRGGFAEVYLARDKNSQKDVAVKVVTPNGNPEPWLKHNIYKEAAILRHLQHPHIVTYIDTIHVEGNVHVRDSDMPSIVMEYCSQGSLETCLISGHLNEEKATRIMQHIGLGLEFLHNEGIVHCDLKPQNILITNDGIAKIADFGLSKVLNTNTEEWSRPYQDEKPTPGCGNCHYWPPEVFRQGEKLR